MAVVVGTIDIVVFLAGGFADGVGGGSLARRVGVAQPRLRLGLGGGDPRRHDVDAIIDDDHHSNGKVEGTNRCIKLVTCQR